ncbi:MAG TPA: N,N-dimethylformamidase beta subunit family domain-containing protein, partial [Gaiellaceae bacterium]
GPGPAGPARTVAWRRTLTVPVPPGPSGLYFVRLSAPGGLVGYAPFVMRPRRLGEHRVAIVEPTNTWQAYNFRDVDGNGVGDTWYADPSYNGVDLTRPFLRHGVPPHFRGYDWGFLRWLARSGHRADFISDDDLERLSGRRLAQLYDLVVFPGHEEYVTGHAYDVLRRYRDLGGNLMFLSANNLFWKATRQGHVLRRGQMWRRLGRPEASLVGVQWSASSTRDVEAPFVVQGATALPWAFAGTGLRNGSPFGRFGVEIDSRGPSSPPGTRVLARIPNLIGKHDAEMTYYETAAGARVFAAGTVDFAASITDPAVAQLVDNVWARLAR